MNRKLIIVGATTLLAFGATYVLLRSGTAAAPGPAAEAALRIEVEQVLVAAGSINGTAVNEGATAWQSWPKGAVSELMITKLPGGTAQLFAANCAACHGIAAQGSRDTYFPSLFHNSALAAGGGRNLIAAILFGISRSTTDSLAFMPGFGGKTTDIADLSDEQVAQLANFLLQHYGDTRYSVTPNLVKQVRDRQSPAPVLMTLVTVGEWVGGTLLLALVI
jgi:mono/diheme cytochrome c family protein